MSAVGKGQVISFDGGQSSKPVPLWSGFRIGNCRVEGVIDRSAIAITYHGQDQVLGRSVLIKECAPVGLVRRRRDGTLERRPGADVRAHAEILREFTMRARALANTEHKGIARVHSLLSQGDGAYLIMQSERGLRLDQHVNTLGPLSASAVVALHKSLLRALDHLHGQQLVHRAVRPSRIRLGQDGTPVLLDFGLALNAAGAPTCNDLTRYSAPEEFARQPHNVDRAADFYGLASTLCFALCGQPPPSPPERVAALRERRADPMQAYLQSVEQRCPPALTRAIVAALSLDPSRRPAGVQEWLARMARPEAPPAEPEPRRVGVLRRRGPWLALGTLGLALLAGLALWHLGTGGDTRAPARVQAPTAAEQAAAEAARRAEIASLLAEAESDIEASRLVEPAGSSAHDKLQRVLALDPGNLAATEMLDRIVERFLASARLARNRGDWQMAELFLAGAERVAPHRASVIGERRKLAAATERPAPATGPVAEPQASPAATPATASTASTDSIASTDSLPTRAATPAPVSRAPDALLLESATFMMGSTREEQDRGNDEALHLVSLPPYSIGRHEVTVAEFSRFVEATGYVTDAERDDGGWPGCLVFTGDAQWAFKPNTNWRQPGFAQGPEHPVVCVSYADASAYVQWRRHQTGLPYRLPTEAEWEYAARSTAGNETDGSLCARANAADRSMTRALQKSLKVAQNCDDGDAFTATVGARQPVETAPADMLGNVWEWTCSDYDAAYQGAEQRCAVGPAKAQKAVRGGAWSDPPSQVRVANRGRLPPEYRYANLGFRVALDAY